MLKKHEVQFLAIILAGWKFWYLAIKSLAFLLKAQPIKVAT
jgi:hypothetical protein